MLEDYAHLDYLWCDNASEDIYEKIIKLVNGRPKSEGSQYSQDDESTAIDVSY